MSDPTYAQFASVFASFQERESDGLGPVDVGPSKGEIYYSDEEDEDEESRARAKKAYEQQGMTRRERRQAAVRRQFCIHEASLTFRNSPSLSSSNLSIVPRWSSGSTPMLVIRGYW